MRLEEKEILAEVMIGLTALLFIIEYLRFLYRKRNSITVIVDSCIGCPFKNEWKDSGDNTFYNCNLKKVVDVNNLSHKSHSDLNKTCPVKGKPIIKVV